MMTAANRAQRIAAPARVFRILNLLRFQLLLVAFAFALSQTDAIHDAWYAAADKSSAALIARSAGAILLATVAVGFVNWLTARIMLRFGFPHFPGVVDPAIAASRLAAEHLPRVLGTAVFVAVGGTAVWLGLSSHFGTLTAIGSVILVFGALFYWFLVIRRKLLKQESVAEELRKSAGGKSVAQAIGADAARWRGWFAAGWLAFAVLMVLVGVFAPASIEALARWSNVIVICLLAATLIAPVGTVIVYFGNLWRVPLLFLILAYCVVVSLTNENHAVRLCAAMRSTGTVADCPAAGAAAPVMQLREYAGDWIKAQDAGADGRIPAIVVATEGGGIRAAYWTAAVLEHLELESARTGSRRFSQHVFAISAVSGGSVGAVVFASDIPADGSPMPPGILDGLDGSFTKDALAPTMANFFFTDLPQRFLPWPLVSDRATALEHAWERQFTHVGQPLDILSPSTGATRRPLLLLNSTAVGGERVVVSPLRYGTAEQFRADFPEALDGAALLGTTGLPASSAALTSARFPFVSPAGVSRPPGKRPAAIVRLVDGGYFDNSGAVTARDVITLLAQLRKEHPQLDIALLTIRNDPQPAYCGDMKVAASRAPSGRALAPEVLSPLLALANARGTRSEEARSALINSLALNRVFDFRLYNLLSSDCGGPTPRLPLSWLLSNRSVTAMRKQIDPAATAAANGMGSQAEASRLNGEAVNQVMAFLGKQPSP